MCASARARTCVCVDVHGSNILIFSLLLQHRRQEVLGCYQWSEYFRDGVICSAVQTSLSSTVDVFCVHSLRTFNNINNTPRGPRTHTYTHSHRQGCRSVPSSFSKGCCCSCELDNLHFCSMKSWLQFCGSLSHKPSGSRSFNRKLWWGQIKWWTFKLIHAAVKSIVWKNWNLSSKTFDCSFFFVHSECWPSFSYVTFLFLSRDSDVSCDGMKGWWKGQLDFPWPQRLKSEETQPFILKSHPISPSESRHQWLESSVED